MYSIYITPVAETDVLESALWYEFQRKGLEQEFFISIEASISLIARNPLLFQVIDSQKIRRAVTRKFPYGIFFYIDNEEIVVIAVLHLSGSPTKWKRRTVKY